MRGVRIGSDEIGFHFGVGMSIRNTLRCVLPNHQLPMLTDPPDPGSQNWNDFYMGALMDLARELQK